MPKLDETADILSARGNSNEMWIVISSSSGVRALPVPRQPRVIIGRMNSCDIVVDEESVSRQHAALVMTPQGIAVEDLGSRNKTKVHGRALGRGELVHLPVGSIVEIGYVTMFVQLGAPAISRQSQGMPAAPPSSHPGEAVVLDPTMQRLYALLEVIAPSPLNVLILGETGTGKEVFAEAVHKNSKRANAPFMRVNCAALSGSLLESELFGHERGAFTGAVGAKAGLFEAAHGGTVFLDEVGELPADTQAKLLRVIERGEVIRLGSVHAKRVDVRYVAATNRDVQQFINDGRFRADLYFRLNGFTITLPPLRKRPREILALAQLFLSRAAHGRPYAITQEAHQALEAYPWPGNIRELKNVLERALVLSGPQGRIETEHLQLTEVRHPDAHLQSGGYEVVGTYDTVPPIPYAGGNMPGTWPPPAPQYPMPAINMGPPNMGMPMAAPVMTPMGATPVMGIPAAIGSDANLRAQRETWEKQQILQALEKTSGNQKEAAKLLGVSRRTLINKIEAYGIARPRKRTP